MKNFFKNPLNITLVTLIGLVVFSIILAQIWDVFVAITVFLLAVLFFYLSFYTHTWYKSKSKLKEFFNDESENNSKMQTLLKKENSLNKNLMIYGFLVAGLIVSYFFITMLKIK